MLQLCDFNFNAYLVDVTTLRETLNPSLWHQFFDAFLDEKLERVGFDVGNDLKFVQTTFPALRQRFISEKPKFIDVKKLTTAIVGNFSLKEKIFLNDFPETVSLVNIVQCLLGIQLQKEERLGNWETRPLRPEQMIYAAEDAYYSLACFDNIYATIYS